MSRFASVLGATLLPMSIVWLGTASAYWSGTNSGNWLPSYLSWLLGLGLGVSFFQNLSDLWGDRLRKPAVGVYAAVCMAVLLWVGLMTSCGFGDCL